MGAMIIYLSFSCPAKNAVGLFSGSALMQDEKSASEILYKTIKAVKILSHLKYVWDGMMNL